MDLCLSTLPLPDDRRPMWLRSHPIARKFSAIVALRAFDGVREEARLAYDTFTRHGAYFPTVTRDRGAITLEWREDDRFFALVLEPGCRPRWASGHLGQLAELESGPDLADVLDGFAQWLSPPRPKGVKWVG